MKYNIDEKRKSEVFDENNLFEHFSSSNHSSIHIKIKIQNLKEQTDKRKTFFMDIASHGDVKNSSICDSSPKKSGRGSSNKKLPYSFA